MDKIKPTIFKITEKEVKDMFFEMKESGYLNKNRTLNKKQIFAVLDYVECDEFLAKDIRRSIGNSIKNVVV
jgi:hypothetical protein